jgi:orotate phosphoribosyltransferase
LSDEELQIARRDQPVSLYLPDSSEPLIRVTSDSPQAGFLCEFARRCFFTGRFVTKGGSQNRWILDCRVGLGQGDYAQTLAREIVLQAKARGALQFAGTGFGSYLLLGAILGVEKQARVGLLRTNRKTFGRKTLIEGDLNTNQPVCVIDDVINSGRTACQAVEVLRQEGFVVNHCLCLFHFNWGCGVESLAKEGVECSGLATVSRSGQPRSETSASASRSMFSQLFRAFAKFFN